MSIQGNINQMLSLAGLLASQTPIFEKSKEKSEIKKASARAEREKAEAKAKIAAEEEARRIAISRSITEGISYSPETEKYLEERYKGSISNGKK